MLLPKKTKTPRWLFFLAGVLIVVGVGLYFWQNYKYKLANRTIKDAVTTSTDSLYTISYDSLHIDEVSGRGFLKNVRIKPDTARVRRLSGRDRPSVLLDVSIHSITITGVNTAVAMAGNRMIADSVLINHPQITMYTIMPLEKNTKIEAEAGEVYQQILGNLHLIKVGYVLVDSINVTSFDFYNGRKGFDFLNGNIQLDSVLIDSAHHEDTSRTLFCQSAAFTVDSFFSFSNNRRELSVEKVAFSGDLKTLIFDKISLDRFTDKTSKGVPLLKAEVLKFSGVNSNAIVKQKSLVVDSVECDKITVYEPPSGSLEGITDSKPDSVDSLGFRNVYSIALQYLHFGRMDFVPHNKKNFDLGNVSLTIHKMESDRLLNVQRNPLRFSHKVEAAIESIVLRSKNNDYNFGCKDLKFNSFKKTLYIGEAYTRPAWKEQAFADHFKYQRDRYEVTMKGITLHGIEMENLFENKLIASRLIVKNTVAKIYRDLNKPLEEKSKVGNYPSQLIYGLDFPFRIDKAVLSNAMIQYREKQVASQKTGTLSFEQTGMTISNMTNIKSRISQNNQMRIEYDTRVLGKIPLKGNFSFTLGSKSGKFSGQVQSGSFDAGLLNPVSEPMGLIRIRKGRINSIDFDISGNDLNAKGDLVMKYEDLRVDVMKKKDSSSDLKKRGLVTFLANIVVDNANPQDGDLREEHPEFKRNIYKSFFNLVWKTIFTGMKSTIGLP